MHMQRSNRVIRILLATGLAAAPPLVFGQGQNAADDQTMMQGGSPMMGGSPPGSGTGPDMMGGSAGMMAPGMMGPGAGMGPGMMGPGMGAGPGMGGGFGFGPIEALNLSADQQRKINSIRDDLRKQHWNLLGQIQDQQAALRDLYAAEQTDPKKVSEAYNKIGGLQAQMAEKHAQALNQVRSVLTPEQRQQLSQMQRGYPPRGYGAPARPSGGMMGQ